jgi:hypothetical protein
MTKKHFIEMAEEFRFALEATDMPEARAGVILAIEGFIRVARSVNSQFNRDRFRRACGLSD